MVSSETFLESYFLSRVIHRDNPYVIAEVGINHNGDKTLAKEMIIAAADAGADCVKFQSFIADEYISPVAQRASYQDSIISGNKSQLELIQECEITIDDMAEFQEYAKNRGLDFLSTPFEVTSLNNLVSIGIAAIKVSSCNLTNYPFLNAVAETGLPVLLSTGMSDMAEVAQAVKIFAESKSELLLFQCTSNYPAKIENANLGVIESFKKAFQVPVAYSDHTVGNVSAIASIALGAVAVEKHFTLSRSLPGIDQDASIEPAELKELVLALRQCRTALGSNLKKCADDERDTAAALRRSLVAATDIREGDVLEADMVTFMRPGTGLPTDALTYLLGRRFRVAVESKQLIRLEHFASK
jgi:sialic acid synthase SpsE